MCLTDYLLWEQEVGGSNPLAPTSNFNTLGLSLERFFITESIARIIEREEAEAEIRKHQAHIEALIKKTATKMFFEKTNE